MPDMPIWTSTDKGVLNCERRKMRSTPVIARVGGKNPPTRPHPYKGRTVRLKPRFTKHRRGAGKIAAGQEANPKPAKNTPL